MSTMRASRLEKLIKGPNGRNLCRFCKTVECKPPRRTFCSDKCVEQWKIRSDPGYARSLVFRRDKGVCVQCSVDTEALRAPYSAARWQPADGYTKSEKIAKELVALGWPHPRESFWQADHIVPVVEGGGECGLDNLRTLCTLCHKVATRELRARLAAKRKG